MSGMNSICDGIICTNCGRSDIDIGSCEPEECATNNHYHIICLNCGFDWITLVM